MKRLFFILVVWFCAVSLSAQHPNDNIDDTQYLQKWIEECRSTSEDKKPLAPGKWICSDRLLVRQSMGLELSGSGGQNRSPSPTWNQFRYGTIIEWRGPSSKPIFEFVGCTGLVFERINIVVASGKDCAQHILIRDGSGALNIAFRDFGMLGGRVGIQCGTEIRESTCANITYDNVHWENQTKAAVRIVNLQSLEHYFLRPKFAFCPIAIDVKAGGDVSVQGGGTYEVGSLLHLTNISSNTRGFDIHSVRFDGKQKRTAWVTFENQEQVNSYGTITFSNCSQNNGQKKNELPLITVAPGSRVVLRDCSLYAGKDARDNWARIYSSSRATGELFLIRCDGIWKEIFEELISSKSARGYYKFVDCGDMTHGPAASLSTFPE